MRLGFFCLFVLVAAPGLTQTPAPYVPTFTFDVAMVRESEVADSYRVGFMVPVDSSMVKLTNNSIQNLIALAYDVQFYQLAGVPDSLSHAMFNVEARSDAETDAKLAALPKDNAFLEKRHMIQLLLAERFHLKTHWETREGPVYDLVVIKRGAKFAETKGVPPSAEETKRFGDHPVPAFYQSGSSVSGFQFTARGAPIENLVQILSANFGRPVVDETGLTGKYDFTIHYLHTRADEVNDSEPAQWPPLETAIQDQLGLKLESAKGPVRTLVVDHMEKPTAN